MRTKMFLAVLLPLCLAAPFDDIANYDHEDVSQVKFNQQLRLLFKIMDIDQNRQIDAEELMLICLENDIDIPAAEAERIVTLPGLLTMDKFVELLADCPSDKTADILLYLVHAGGNGGRRERILGFFNTWKSQFMEQITQTQNILFGHGTTVAPTTKAPSSTDDTITAELKGQPQSTIAPKPTSAPTNPATSAPTTPVASALTTSVIAAIDGGWTHYGSCTKTCKGGVKTRTCTNPSPQHGGKECTGEASVPCNQNLDCSIDGGWTHYGSCTKTCKGGVKTRTCTNPSPQHGGKECTGEASVPCNQNLDCSSCSVGATLLSTSPRHDMVLCKDETEQTCQKDFETLCPAGWRLCTPGQFNNRNHGWDYNWVKKGAGKPLGVIYCAGRTSGSWGGHYGILDSNPVLNTEQELNCLVGSSRPSCQSMAGVIDCDHKSMSALCCKPTTTCGDGEVQEEEDCDDGNDSNIDDCLNTCTWKNPEKHGLFGEGC